MAAAMQISARAASRCSRTIIARLPTGLDVFDTSLAGIPSSTRTLKTAAEDTTPQAAAGGQSEVKVEESHRFDADRTSSDKTSDGDSTQEAYEHTVRVGDVVYYLTASVLGLVVCSELFLNDGVSKIGNYVLALHRQLFPWSAVASPEPVDAPTELDEPKAPPAGVQSEQLAMVEDETDRLRAAGVKVVDKFRVYLRTPVDRLPPVEPPRTDQARIDALNERVRVRDYNAAKSRVLPVHLASVTPSTDKDAPPMARNETAMSTSTSSLWASEGSSLSRSLSLASLADSDGYTTAPDGNDSQIDWALNVAVGQALDDDDTPAPLRPLSPTALAAVFDFRAKPLRPVVQPNVSDATS